MIKLSYFLVFGVLIVIQLFVQIKTQGPPQPNNPNRPPDSPNRPPDNINRPDERLQRPLPIPAPPNPPRPFFQMQGPPRPLPPPPLPPQRQNNLPFPPILPGPPRPPIAVGFNPDRIRIEGFAPIQKRSMESSHPLESLQLTSSDERKPAVSKRDITSWRQKVHRQPRNNVRQDFLNVPIGKKVKFTDVSSAAEDRPSDDIPKKPFSEKEPLDLDDSLFIDESIRRRLAEKLKVKFPPSPMDQIQFHRLGNAADGVRVKGTDGVTLTSEAGFFALNQTGLSDDGSPDNVINHTETSTDSFSAEDSTANFQVRDEDRNEDEDDWKPNEEETILEDQLASTLGGTSTRLVTEAPPELNARKMAEIVTPDQENGDADDMIDEKEEFIESQLVSTQADRRLTPIRVHPDNVIEEVMDAGGLLRDSVDEVGDENEEDGENGIEEDNRDENEEDDEDRNEDERVDENEEDIDGDEDKDKDEDKDEDETEHGEEHANDTLIVSDFRSSTVSSTLISVRSTANEDSVDFAVQTSNFTSKTTPSFHPKAIVHSEAGSTKSESTVWWEIFWEKDTKVLKNENSEDEPATESEEHFVKFPDSDTEDLDNNVSGEKPNLSSGLDSDDDDTEVLNENDETVNEELEEYDDFTETEGRNSDLGEYEDVEIEDDIIEESTESAGPRMSEPTVPVTISRITIETMEETVVIGTSPEHRAMTQHQTVTNAFKTPSKFIEEHIALSTETSLFTTPPTFRKPVINPYPTNIGRHNAINPTEGTLLARVVHFTQDNAGAVIGFVMGTTAVILLIYVLYLRCKRQRTGKLEISPGPLNNGTFPRFDEITKPRTCSVLGKEVVVDGCEEVILTEMGPICPPKINDSLPCQPKVLYIQDGAVGAF